MIESFRTGSGQVLADRKEAGEALARRLEHLRNADPLVLALPRGGVVVGAEVAKKLDAELDVFVARKLGAPGQPELAIGAIAPGGVYVVDPMAVQVLGVTREYLDQVVRQEAVEVERRLEAFRGDRPFPDVEDRTVILVDDGLATGMTARAAIHALRDQNPERLILAVPVCAPETAESISGEVDELVCMSTPQPFRAVGLWYRNFEQTTDQEVLSLLEENWRSRPAERASGAEGQGGTTAGSWEVAVDIGRESLAGSLSIPEGATGVVLFAHGSGSSRHSPRNRYVAEALQRAGLATLLIDLLTQEEEHAERYSRHLRFDIGMLADRLGHVTDWLHGHPATRRLRIGYFGASTGGGAALVAAASHPEVGAVVSRGGRPDLAGPVLAEVSTPTLLLVGGLDAPVITLNQQALVALASPEKQLVIVPGASHLFEEPGTLEEVARLAAAWFVRYLAGEGEGSR